MNTDADQQSVEPRLFKKDPWTILRRYTRARVALGRAGTSLPTAALLAFQLDHARAVDAVHQQLNTVDVCHALGSSLLLRSLIPEAPIVMSSEAADRLTYLQRPDLGRRLCEADCQLLHEIAANREERFDLAILVGDGLSAAAVQQNALPFLEAFFTFITAAERKKTFAPIVVATQARVALGDDVGESLGARMVLVLIGERPGLTSPDSMGAYLTWMPKRGTLDSRRNCISNIRPDGLGAADAAAKAFYLLSEAQRLKCTGVELKDRDSDTSLTTHSEHPARTSFRLTGNTSTGNQD